jgi:D-threo-aldose 1-dehydrogenase
MGAVALQFSMRDPRITSTIVGVTKPGRVAETLDWAGTDIPEELWQELEGLPTSADDPEANREYKLG